MHVAMLPRDGRCCTVLLRSCPILYLSRPARTEILPALLSAGRLATHPHCWASILLHRLLRCAVPPAYAPPPSPLFPLTKMGQAVARLSNQRRMIPQTDSYAELSTLDDERQRVFRSLHPTVEEHV